MATSATGPTSVTDVSARRWRWTTRRVRPSRSVRPAAHPPGRHRRHGPSDIIYLGRDGARLYFNAGQQLERPRRAARYRRHEQRRAWTCRPARQRHACLCGHLAICPPMRAARALHRSDGRAEAPRADGGSTTSAQTEIDYAPPRGSTCDKPPGSPWVTRLPFPVHASAGHARTWRGARVRSTYSYHHGFYDGVEREFRGFGRVEQVDMGEYDGVRGTTPQARYVTPDQTLYQPPVKSITWYHTGAAIERAQGVLNQFELRILSAALRRSALPSAQGRLLRAALPEPESFCGRSHLTGRTSGVRPCVPARAWCCARRCKRTGRWTPSLWPVAHRNTLPVHLFSAATRNCRVRRIQPRRHQPRTRCFLVTESEAVSYQYELPLGGDRSARRRPARRTHAQSSLRRLRPHAAVGRGGVSATRAHTSTIQRDPAPLTAEQLALVRDVQSELHVAYTEPDYTSELPFGRLHHRLPAPCEVRTYELTGVTPTPLDNGYLTPEALRDLKLNPTLDVAATQQVVRARLPAAASNRQAPQTPRRARRDALLRGRPVGAARARADRAVSGCTYENYKLALTDSLLTDVLASGLGTRCLCRRGSECAEPGGGAPGVSCEWLPTRQRRTGHARGRAMVAALGRRGVCGLGRRTLLPA